MDKLGLKVEQTIENVEEFSFDQQPIKGQPELRWRGKRPFTSTQFYPAQLRETYGEETDGWINKIFWGDNLQVMSHLLKKYRGQVDLIYIDPPFDSDADYKKKIKLHGKIAENDKTAFEEKQYTDIWSNDEYLQFMYERLILMRELLSDNGSIYLHCDWHQCAFLKCIMDEVFGSNNFMNEIIWCYQERETSTRFYNRKHDNILFYVKSNGKSNYIFNPLEITEEYSPVTLKKFKYTDENGRKYRLRGKDGTNDPSVEDDNTYRQYLDESTGTLPRDWFNMAILNQAATERTPYPTQKPEALLERIIKASSNPGSLIFDCFMGSGTTQAVAMKLGRRFIGADINLGAIDTTVKRLTKTSQDIISALPTDDITRYTGFEVYNVNNYDVFRNPVQARDLLIEALEMQPLPGNGLYDGEKDGRMMKIMPINRIATRADLNNLINGFPRDIFDKRKEANPVTPVESITLVCMGHEPDLAAHLKLALKEEGYILDVEVLDILRDKVNLEFRRDSEAEIEIEGNRLVIREFYPMNLLQKLSMDKEAVDDWRTLVSSVKIDFNFDGSVFSPSVIDIPEGSNLVSGIYDIPADAGTIKVKITDVLSESLETTLKS